jgi:hypothetical protein
LNATVLQTIPGVLSMATILLEFFFAVAFLVRPLWRFAIPLTIAFMMWLEFMLRPDLFPWDVMAILLLLLPAGDRAYTIRYNRRSTLCVWASRILSRLDWLRRLHWAPVEPKGEVGEEGFVLISPERKMQSGFDAARAGAPSAGTAAGVVYHHPASADRNRILGIVSASEVSFLMFAGRCPRFPEVTVPRIAPARSCSAWLSRLLPSDP